jgi:hypothetical protein
MEDDTHKETWTPLAKAVEGVLTKLLEKQIQKIERDRDLGCKRECARPYVSAKPSRGVHLSTPNRRYVFDFCDTTADHA